MARRHSGRRARRLAKHLAWLLERELPDEPGAHYSIAVSIYGRAEDVIVVSSLDDPDEAADLFEQGASVMRTPREQVDVVRDGAGG